MKRSQIVSYTSEELKQMPSESDWEANAAMTEEEIRAAIADDPDDSELSVEWLRTHVVKPAEETATTMFILVHDEQGHAAMRRVDKVLAGKNGESGYVRVVDDTGKTYRVPVS
jgi:hypothetical protein